MNNELDVEHEHDWLCAETDIMDMGDDGDGYVAYEVLVCKVTGEQIPKGYFDED